MLARPRYLLRVLHRDIGYLAFGLTVVYGLSGLAVNHVHDWNPNYRSTAVEVSVGPLAGDTVDGLAADAAGKLGLAAGEVLGKYQPSAGEIALLLDHGGEARLDIATGVGRIERIARRPVVFEANVLHLNRLRGMWTPVADAFAALMIFLAMSGILLLKGRAGLSGRGKWLVALGIVVPLIFLIVLDPLPIGH